MGLKSAPRGARVLRKYSVSCIDGSRAASRAVKDLKQSGKKGHKERVIGSDTPLGRWPGEFMFVPVWGLAMGSY